MTDIPTTPQEDERESRQPETPVEIEFAIDGYSVKTKVPYSSLDEPQQPPTIENQSVRTAAEVWNDCLGNLQDSLVGLTAFLRAIPRTATQIVQSIGGMAQAGAEYLRRIAQGRSRADHGEDERIAQVECNPDPLQSTEVSTKQIAVETALDRLSELTDEVAANGHELKLVKTPEGKLIVLAVPKEVQRVAVEAAQAKLPESNVKKIDLTWQDPLGFADYGVSPRIIKILADHKIKTLDQLASMTEADLLKLKGIGPKSVKELRWHLKK